MKIVVLDYSVFNSNGKLILSGKTEGLRTLVTTTVLRSGVYLVSVNGKTKIVYKIEN